MAPTATLVVGWIHSLKNRSWSIFPYQLNSDDRAVPLVSIEPDLSPVTALAGATFTDSFRDSSFVFFCSEGVALFFGEGFGVAFGSGVFFGLGRGVGFTEAFGTGVGVTVRFGDGGATGVGAGVGVAS